LYIKETYIGTQKRPRFIYKSHQYSNTKETNINTQKRPRHKHKSGIATHPTTVNLSAQFCKFSPALLPQIPNYFRSDNLEILDSAGTSNQLFHTLQHTATHWVLNQLKIHRNLTMCNDFNALQHTATHCNTLGRESTSNSQEFDYV